MTNTFNLNHLKKLIVFLFLLTADQGISGEIVYPDFKTSMLRKVPPYCDATTLAKREKVYDSVNSKFLKIFTDIYTRNIEKVKSSPQTDSYRIPRVVHQIWLGSPVPEEYFAWMKTWMNLYGWEYRLWTDEDVKKMKLYNQDLYDCADNYGEKSDILRLEILFRHGGLYVDTDFECLKPEIFNDIHRNFDFYIGFEPLEHGLIKRFNMFKVCNALMGSIPRHPLIKDFIDNLRANYYAYRPFHGTVEKTGPSYLTRIICEYVQSESSTLRDMYFPTTFFYPFSLPEIHNACSQPGECTLEALPETAGIHYWNQSWMKKNEKKN